MPPAPRVAPSWRSGGKNPNPPAAASLPLPRPSSSPPEAAGLSRALPVMGAARIYCLSVPQLSGEEEDRHAGAKGRRPRRWLLPRRLPPPVSRRLWVLVHRRDLARLGQQFMRRRCSVGGHFVAALRGWCGSMALRRGSCGGSVGCWRPRVQGLIWAAWARSGPPEPQLLLGAGGRRNCGGGLRTYDIHGMVLRWFLGMFVRPSGWVVRCAAVQTNVLSDLCRCR
jgi:hypothetical protein